MLGPPQSLQLSRRPTARGACLVPAPIPLRTSRRLRADHVVPRRERRLSSPEQIFARFLPWHEHGGAVANRLHATVKLVIVDIELVRLLASRQRSNELV